MTSMPTPDGSERLQDDTKRRKPEEWRSEAQTDMDRIWYASEFRRLEGVTQVVPPQDEYVFHDRLTHSMKVAQVAATLARMILHGAASNDELQQALGRAGLKLTDWVDPDHCYAAGLAHDIGHPPFGHAGEAALQSLRPASAAIRSFEGNAQSTRIVASLSFRKADEPGLNLTLRTLAAIAKYPWLRFGHPHQIAKLAKKWSFYPEEKELHTRLEDRGFIRTIAEADPNAPKRRPSSRVVKVYRWPEAEIMDWSDDISYAVHDIEDFFRAGRIPLHRISAALKLAPEFLAMSQDQKAERQASDTITDWRQTDFGFSEDDEEVQEALVYARAKMLRQLDDDGRSISEHVPAAFEAIYRELLLRMPNNRFDGSNEAHYSLQNFGSAAITYLTVQTSVEVIRVGTQDRIRFRVDPVARLVAEFFKAVCQYFVINTSSVATMQQGQSKSLLRLVEALKGLVLKWQETDWDPYARIVPAKLRSYLLREAAVHGDGLTSDQIEVAVVDYVCSLRDVQATILESRLFGDRSSLDISEAWIDA